MLRAARGSLFETTNKYLSLPYLGFYLT